jgi:hypothetical protein
LDGALVQQFDVARRRTGRVRASARPKPMATALISGLNGSNQPE